MSLQERLKHARRPGGYDPGDRLELALKDAAGVEHNSAFEVEAYCGGGFAGQVYRARCVETTAPGVAVGQSYAVKFFCTRSGGRRRFRDALYWLAFQSPFPHQYNEDAVRTGLPLTRLLQRAFKEEFGTADAINACQGTFWDEHVGSFGEVNEWVEGYVTDPEIDAELLTRWAHNRRVQATGEGEPVQCHSEIARKHRFMDRMVALCWSLGLADLARQVYWWTGMSQANVLTRTRSRDTGRPEFVWVDRRPGLPGFILSLGDVVLFWRALWRRSVPPFDRIDFRRLRQWFAQEAEPEITAAIDELERLDRRYRRSQLDLFGHHFRLLTDASLRRDIARGRIEYWRLSERLDEAASARLLRSPLRYLGHLLLSLLPLVGRPLQRLLGNARWRRHLKRLLTEAPYRHEQFETFRVETLKVWLAEGYTTPSHAEVALQSAARFLWDLGCGLLTALVGGLLFLQAPFLVHAAYASLGTFGETLSTHLFGEGAALLVARLACLAVLGYGVSKPPALQLFLTDGAYRADLLRRLVTAPLKYVFDGAYRRQVNMDWLRQQTADDLARGFVDEAHAQEYIRLGGDRAIQEYLTGTLATASVLFLSETTYIIGAGYLYDRFAEIRTGLTEMGFWAVPLVLLISLISPGGIVRWLYCVIRGLFSRGVSYWAALALAPFRMLGYLAFPVQIAKTYPDFANYVLTAAACRLAERVPVFGEQGGLLSIWTVSVLLSWPASYRRWRRERRNSR